MINSKKFIFKREILYTVNTTNEHENPEDEENNEVDLNQNHTHFILVDDGSCGSQGNEIEFRAKLENELRKGKSNIYYEKCRLSRLKRQISSLSDRNLELTDEEESEAHHNKENEDEELKPGLKKDIIPMVLIVIQGEWKILKVVEDAIKKNVPILVLAVRKNNF